MHISCQREVGRTEAGRSLQVGAQLALGWGAIGAYWNEEQIGFSRVGDSERVVVREQIIHPPLKLRRSTRFRLGNGGRREIGTKRKSWQRVSIQDRKQSGGRRELRTRPIL